MNQTELFLHILTLIEVAREEDDIATVRKLLLEVKALAQKGVASGVASPNPPSGRNAVLSK